MLRLAISCSFLRSLVCIAWLSMFVLPVAGQEAAQVLRAEYKGICKSLLPDACSSANKAVQQAPLELTRTGEPAHQVRAQRRYEERLVERFNARLIAAHARASASKTSNFSVAVNEQDSLALVALYEALDGANWTDNAEWLTGPVSTWNGVVVNEAGRVVELNLESNRLFGFIPAELTELTELLLLDLGDNFLLGVIPAQIGNLSNLEVLDLSFNILTNEIPTSIGNMTNLFELVLWGNNLSGEIPGFLPSLANLEVLSLEFNQLEGSIPPDLGLLPNLVELYLDQNLLSGTIPPELGNLTNLVSIFLGSNELTGTIPVELMGIEGLEVLSIFNAELSGPLPKELGNLQQLAALDLGSNNFEGPIPDELLNLFFLANLYLDNNQLTGEIPSDIGLSLMNLTELSLSGNLLEGAIPASIGGLLVLRYLDLGSNLFSGTIPDLNQNQRLRFLYLDDNDLTGEIVNQFVAFFGLVEFNLSNNNLSGIIPPSLANSPFMVDLRLANNGFFGSIPPELTVLENLQVLDLWNNELEGPIPADVVNQVNLQTLDLGWNALTGSLPEGLDQLDGLQNLFLDINELSGAIPESITGADSIRVLILNDNFLTHVPDLSEVASLDSVSLGNNLLGFDSIEPNLGIAEGRISYAPQRPLPVIVDELDTTIQFASDIGGSANQYQWFLGSTALTGATEAVYEAPYAALVGSDDIVLEVISRLVPNLILATEPIPAEARLTQVVIAPFLQTINPGDRVQFEYAGLDQFNNTRRFSGSWAAQGGIIDQTGLYVAGSEPGEYSVTVSNSLGVQVGETTFNISGPVSNETSGQIIQAYALGANYPNPFSASTDVTIEIPEASHVQLNVYNVLGQKMNTVVDQLVQPGIHRFSIGAEHWPAGLYVYTLQADGFYETRAMVKVH